MMKIGKLLAGVCLACCLGSCSDNDGRDDTILDMSYLTGKDWYYNAWLGDKNSTNSQDLLEVLRFEKGGALKNIDFSGRREYSVGTWTSEGNKITLNYKNSDPVVWNVQRSGDDYIKTVVNEQGIREYSTDLGYLGNLTADAFLVNDYTQGNQYRTYIGVDVRGNMDVREGALLNANGKNVALKNHEYYWSESSPEYIDFNGRKQEVRFYLRIGKNTHLKLKDTIYSDNLPQRVPDEMNLSANSKESSLVVNWTPYSNRNVYYRVEILPKNMDVTNPYFISRIQGIGTNQLVIRTTTGGEVNKLSELKSGDSYYVRLTALLYEPGIDPLNDNYGYANVQAVSYFTKLFAWEG